LPVRWFAGNVRDGLQPPCPSLIPILSLLRLPAGLAILWGMFSDAVLDHFEHPRNSGALPGATAAEVINPVCGDVLRLAARVENGCIVEAKFLCRGCTTAIACGSVLTELLRGRTLAEASAITPEHISEALGGLPPATFHGAELAADAVAGLLAQLG
jgi:NifU-like protein involved in Fe-S cluster formation